jgi:hypothetical protein
MVIHVDGVTLHEQYGTYRGQRGEKETSDGTPEVALVHAARRDPDLRGCVT